MKFLLWALLFCAPAFASQTCDQFIQSLPANSIHGFVSVPENWADSHSPQIKIFYYGYHFAENPSATPLVYFNGGPGASVHGMNQYLSGKPDYAKVPFLFIDQRGTGCSSPFPAIEYTREGVQKTALYGTRAIVMDAEAIRKEVFNGMKWRIFGQSYGAFIVHRYLELAPEGLLAAYAHGGAVMHDGISWTENRTRSFKRVGEMYFQKYPEDRELISRAHLLFPKNYCMHGLDADVCGDGILDVWGWSNLSFPDFGLWESLHQKIQKVLLPTGELDMDFIRKEFPEQAGPLDPASFLVDVVPAREAPGGLCNTWSCELAIPQMESKGEQPMQYEFNECRIALATKRHFDYHLIKEVVGEDYPSIELMNFNLETHPQLKFFLYSGEMDTFGPRENCLEEVKLFGTKAHYTNFASGHGSYFEEPQIWRDILSTQ